MKKDYQKNTTTGAVEVPLPDAVSVTMAELAVDESVTALAGPRSSCPSIATAASTLFTEAGCRRWR